MSRDVATDRTFSVVICTHNRADVLGTAIESVLEQDYPRHAFELIVVDNASADDTVRSIPCSSPVLRRRSGGESRTFAPSSASTIPIDSPNRIASDRLGRRYLWRRAYAAGLTDTVASALLGTERRASDVPRLARAAVRMLLSAEPGRTVAGCRAAYHLARLRATFAGPAGPQHDSSG